MRRSDAQRRDRARPHSKFLELVSQVALGRARQRRNEVFELHRTPFVRADLRGDLEHHAEVVRAAEHGRAVQPALAVHGQSVRVFAVRAFESVY